MTTREEFLNSCVITGKQQGKITKLSMRCKEIENSNGDFDYIDEIEMEIDCYKKPIKFSRTKKGGK